MNRTLIFFSIFVNLFGISAHIECVSWSAGLEYTLNDKTENSWGDLNIKIDCHMHGNQQSQIFEATSIGIQYENKPGILGNWGHIRATIKAHHSDIKINTLLQLIASDLNTALNYNPCILEHLNKRIQLQTYRCEAQENLIMLNEQKKQRSILEHVRKIYLLQKQAFEANYKSADPNYSTICNIIDQIEKNNEQ